MQLVRRANERGHANHGWLDSNHTFSFADYYDPEFMGFSVLRVINEDRITGGTGFGAHPHRDMEIISYVVDGALEHRDSMGNVAVIRPGEVQRMSAGTGVVHSEKNQSPNSATHFYQIWIQPEKTGIEPSYAQKSFSEQLQQGKLFLAVSPDGRDGSITINQDAKIYLGRLGAGTGESLALESRDRKVWVQVVKGEAVLNGVTLRGSDGAAFVEEDSVTIHATTDCELIVFDLP